MSFGVRKREPVYYLQAFAVATFVMFLAWPSRAQVNVDHRQIGGDVQIQVDASDVGSTVGSNADSTNSIAETNVGSIGGSVVVRGDISISVDVDDVSNIGEKDKSCSESSIGSISAGRCSTGSTVQPGITKRMVPAPNRPRNGTTLSSSQCERLMSKFEDSDPEKLPNGIRKTVENCAILGAKPKEKALNN